jgi:hypothetical protein
MSKNLIRLLNDLGPERKKHRPEYSFWRMQKDNGTASFGPPFSHFFCTKI